MHNSGEGLAAECVCVHAPVLRGAMLGVAGRVQQGSHSTVRSKDMFEDLTGGINFLCFHFGME